MDATGGLTGHEERKADRGSRADSKLEPSLSHRGGSQGQETGLQQEAGRMQRTSVPIKAQRRTAGAGERTSGNGTGPGNTDSHTLDGDPSASAS